MTPNLDEFIMTLDRDEGRADEYRDIARDCVEMGEHGMAKQFWQLARQTDRERVFRVSL